LSTVVSCAKSLKISIEYGCNEVTEYFNLDTGSCTAVKDCREDLRREVSIECEELFVQV
jgi:hypothetical protein